MFQNAFKHIAWGQVRTVAAAVGGVLVALGVTDTDTVTTTLDAAAVAGGALMTIGAAVGSAYNKVRVERKIETVAVASARSGAPLPGAKID